MKTAGQTRGTTLVDRALGYTGLFVIGAMAWACDRLGVTPSAPRPVIQPVVRGVRS